MQLNPQVKELSLYDIAGTPGVACDISHCNTRALAKVCLFDRTRAWSVRMILLRMLSMLYRFPGLFAALR